jgi:hypothetical protein
VDSEKPPEWREDNWVSFVPANIVGHAGDGNFHVGFMINPNEPGPRLIGLANY